MRKIFLFILLGIINLSAEILEVPAEYESIQTAIDSSISGDTVLVTSATYTENINFLGKNIFVTSQYYFSGDTSDILNTVITPAQLAPVVSFENNEDSSAVLNGFTIRNGINYSGGGGGSVRDSPGCSPTIGLGLQVRPPMTRKGLECGRLRFLSAASSRKRARACQC